MDEYLPLIGHTGEYILKQIMQSKQINLDYSMVKGKNAVYKTLQQTQVLPITSTIHFLHFIKEKGWPTAVASSASREELLHNLQALQITPFFDFILSGKEHLSTYHDPQGVNKPKPYIYMEAAKRLNLNPSECLVIEDSLPGVLAAKTAGCKVIAIPTMWTKNQNLSQADLVLENPISEVILEWIEKQ